MFMKLSVLLVTMGVAVSGMRPKWHELSGEYQFEHYLADFAKTYDDAPEYELRKTMFTRNRDAAIAHNKMGLTWKEGVNHMSDWTPTEFKRLLGLKRTTTTLETTPFVSAGLTMKDVPTNFDWRTASDCVSAVKDQGQCGSCWSFASASVLESGICLKTGLLMDLSPQQIASCSVNKDHCGGTGGCAGGTAEVAFESVIMQKGISSEWVYPYVSHSGSNFACDSTKAKAATITSYTTLPANEAMPLVEALATISPVSVSVDASSWSRYESGVYAGCDKDKADIDHAVVAVGYGTDPELGDYFTIRNSWTPAWGEKGFIRLQRVMDNPSCAVDSTPQDGFGCDNGPSNITVCGECAVLSRSSYIVA